MRLKILFAALQMGGAAAISLGTTLHVPEDYPTIQAAMDSVAHGDTIFVALGTYAESLQAPSRTFVLLGAVNADDQRPIIDPSSLDGSTHLACLTLPYGCIVGISNFVFRNGPQMFPRSPLSAVGGIDNHSSGLLVRHCLFDSTYQGINREPIGPASLTVEDCIFRNNVRGCVRQRSTGAVLISDCDFSAYGDRAIWLVGNGTIQNCQFHDMVQSGEWMWLEGLNNTVTGCDFGPTVTPELDIIWTSLSRGCLFQGNNFHDLEVTGAVIWFNGAAGDTTFIRGNTFRRNHGVQSGMAGAGPLLAEQEDSLLSGKVLLSDNLFDSCYTYSTYGFRAVGMGACNNWLLNNAFLGPAGFIPSVHVSQVDTNLVGNVNLHGNAFNHTGLALSARWPVDARVNWWGDPTGPRHIDNLQGQGDSIAGLHVWYVPWLTEDPLSAPSPHPALPTTCHLEVYPNPFNATATIQLVVNQPGEYEVELFNPLGQRVQQLWSGYVSDRKAITFNGQSLASGIYFAEAHKVIDHRTVAVNKLLMLK